MTNAHCRTCYMARKLKKTENEKYTLQDVKYGKETEKGGKFNMSIVGRGIWQGN